MINLSKLCVHPVSIEIYIFQSVGNLAGHHVTCISADLVKYLPETMSGLVGRGFARSSRNLLSASTIWVPSNLVHAVKTGAERMTVKGCEHCQHRNFSSSCSAAARLYTERHEWVERDGAEARVGITRYAADALGDVVFAELPEQGRQVAKGEEVGAVESVKAASEVYSPLTGTVVASNEAVEDKPGLVNSSPEEDGWLFRVLLQDEQEVAGLMAPDQYQNFLSSQTEDLP